MFIQLGLMIASITAPTVASSISLHDAFNSQKAYTYTAAVAGLGERWPGVSWPQKD
jgi:hypothetical protein